MHPLDKEKRRMKRNSEFKEYLKIEFGIEKKENKILFLNGEIQSIEFILGINKKRMEKRLSDRDRKLSELRKSRKNRKIEIKNQWREYLRKFWEKIEKKRRIESRKLRRN